jgi:hypothetical protein
MEKVTIHIETDVNPTESEEKIRKAVENIFGNALFQTKSGPVSSVGTMTAEARDTNAIVKFQNLLRRERIRAAARKVLLEGVDRNTISFCLNKQVAYAGHISFSKEEAESPLGPIRVKIECENPRRLVDWLTSTLQTSRKSARTGKEGRL